MPIIYLSDHNAQDDTFSEPSLSFRILYRELWERSDSDETNARRKVFDESRIYIPDYEDLQDAMQSRDMEVDTSPGGSVQDDDAAAVSAGVDPDIPQIPCDYTLLNLSWLPTSIADPHQSLLVRQEYKDAMVSFEKNSEPVVLTGQPVRPGKTIFLIYALIERLIKRLPTIYMPSRGSYFLFRQSGAYQFTGVDMVLELLRRGMSDIHGGDVPGGNIDATDQGWILFDSNESQMAPHWYRPTFRTWKVILSSSLKPARYKEWAKQAGANKYVMKPWSWFEICAAMPLQSFESGHQPTIRELWDAYSRFGPSARTVYKFCMDPRVYEEAIRRAVDQCQDPSTLFRQGDCGRNDSLSNVLVVVGPATWDGNIDRRIMSRKVATPYIMDIIHQRAQRLLVHAHSL